MADEITEDKAAPASKRDKVAASIALIAAGAALLYSIITGQQLPTDHVCECPEVVEAPAAEAEPAEVAEPAKAEAAEAPAP